MDMILIALGVVALFLVGGYFLVQKASEEAEKAISKTGKTIKDGIKDAGDAADKITTKGLSTLRTAGDYLSGLPSGTISQAGDALKKALGQTSDEISKDTKKFFDMTQDEIDETGDIIYEKGSEIISLPIDAMTAGYKTAITEANKAWTLSNSAVGNVAGTGLTVASTAWKYSPTGQQVASTQNAINDIGSWMNTNLASNSKLLGSASDLVASTEKSVIDTFQQGTASLWGFKF